MVAEDDNRGECFINLEELVFHKSKPEYALLALAKEKGCPIGGYLLPKFKYGYRYSIIYDDYRAGYLIKWKRE